MKTSTLVFTGDQQDFHLFHIAINVATTGRKVWFIAADVFHAIPLKIGFPEREILKLITFIYLKDVFELLKHLNGMHIQNKLPKVIILYKFCKFVNKEDNRCTSYLCSNLLEAIRCCSRINDCKCCLIIGFDDNDDQAITIMKLYFDFWLSTWDVDKLHELQLF